MLKRNIALNGFKDNFSIFNGDLNDNIDSFEELKRHSFDHIFCNPPYYEEGEVFIPTDKNKKFCAVIVKFKKILKNPVTLEKIKKTKDLSHLALIKQSRLSVMKIDTKSWKIIIKMSNIKKK